MEGKTPDQIISDLQKACEYSDGTDGEESGVDSLIDYKDALESAYAELLAKTEPAIDSDLFRSHDDEVICIVKLSNGETLKGQFSYVDGGAPPGWASFTIYDGGDVETQPEKWKHINPEHIVTIEVWLD